MNEINLPSSLYFYIWLPSIPSSIRIQFHEWRSKEVVSHSPQRRQFPSQCAVANFWLRSWKGEAKPSEKKKKKLANVSNEMSTHRWGGRDKKRKRKKGKKERRVRRSASRRINGPLVLFNPYYGIYLSRARTHERATIQWYSKVRLRFSLFLSLHEICK